MQTVQIVQTLLMMMITMILPDQGIWRSTRLAAQTAAADPTKVPVWGPRQGIGIGRGRGLGVELRGRERLMIAFDERLKWN